MQRIWKVRSSNSRSLHWSNNLTISFKYCSFVIIIEFLSFVNKGQMF
nr:MAG TPA: hypothetical protein [Caudoviricetes sp.]